MVRKRISNNYSCSQVILQLERYEEIVTKRVKWMHDDTERQGRSKQTFPKAVKRIGTDFAYCGTHLDIQSLELY
jgi:hypothetical protein